MSKMSIIFNTFNKNVLGNNQWQRENFASLKSHLVSNKKKNISCHEKIHSVVKFVAISQLFQNMYLKSLDHFSLKTKLELIDLLKLIVNQ